MKDFFLQLEKYMVSKKNLSLHLIRIKFMPQIYRYLKLVFYFVARGEHLPPHVHVIDENSNQSVFDLVIPGEKKQPKQISTSKNKKK